MIQRVILWFVGLLPKKLQQIYARYEEQWLYLIYGVLTTVVSMVTKLVPLYLVHQDAVSKVFYTTYSAGCAVFSWICAVTFAFFTNRKYVFKSGADTKAAFWTEFVAFYVGRLASLCIDVGLTALFIGWLNWNKLLVTIAAQILILVINYLISKLFVFRKKKED